jgi:predicted CopG family antitoxin
MKKNVRIVIEISEDTRTKLKVLKRGYFETYDAVILRLLKRRPND